MSEPTEEQKQAALALCVRHSKTGNCGLVDDVVVARLLAEREAALRAQVATLQAERDALNKNVDQLVRDLRHDGFDYPASNVARFIIHNREGSVGDWYDPSTGRIMYMDPDKAFALRADIERLTKERDEHKFYREQGAEERDQLTTDNARHLETIRALREFNAELVGMLQFHHTLIAEHTSFDEGVEHLESLLKKAEGLDASREYEQADDVKVCQHKDTAFNPHRMVHVCQKCWAELDDVKGGG